jgi:maltooligosyltrehalose trehalohydrolase
MVFLDVVYNHFGPDGNYLHAYAQAFFREDVKTPWGPAIDFRRREVRDFFTGNAIYWLTEYRFDGLRFDAVHAITEPDWLDEMAQCVRAAVPAGRHVHLVLEHDGNVASHLERDFDAQWNDDGHHILHHLVTGESGGYYLDYATQPADLLARCLEQGFIYQGQPSTYRKGERRGEPSGHLDATHFVLFIQNHDQIGNRAMGERLLTLARRGGRIPALRTACALYLLSPQIPLIFMGEEVGSDTPFLYFTSHEAQLAEAVREGRRQEFAQFPEFADEATRASIPDPNAPKTFEASIPPFVDGLSDEQRQWRDEFQRMLRLRHDLLIPRLEGARSLGAQVLGQAAVLARWRLADGQAWTMYVNFSDQPVKLPAVQNAGTLVFESGEGAAQDLARGALSATSLVVYLEPAQS